MKIKKSILNWSEKDLKKLQEDLYNIENKIIDYKEKYNEKTDDLRKDIVSFANSEEGGFILFGIKDNPFELVGITRKDVDNLKTKINQIITSNIDPQLDPPPILNPIYISNELYILGMQIFPKKKGMYAIRESNNSQNSGFYFYTFWIRTDGNNRRLSMEEVNLYILRNCKEYRPKGFSKSEINAITLLIDNPIMGDLVRKKLELTEKFGKKARNFKRKS